MSHYSSAGKRSPGGASDAEERSPVHVHDPMCGFNRESGEFDFMADSCARCEFIARVRADEAPKAVTRWIEQGASSDDWMKVWQVRDYTEQLEARVRADERAVALQDAWAEVVASSLPHLLDEGHPQPHDACLGCKAIERAVLALNRLRGES